MVGKQDNFKSRWKIKAKLKAKINKSKIYKKNSVIECKLHIYVYIYIQKSSYTCN